MNQFDLIRNSEKCTCGSERVWYVMKKSKDAMKRKKYAFSASLLSNLRSALRETTAQTSRMRCVSYLYEMRSEYDERRRPVVDLHFMRIGDFGFWLFC